jgi:putative SOS response-associated peptidase YedK
MCGRFTQHYTWAEVHAFLGVCGPPQSLRPRYNIAPATSVDVIRLNAKGQRELVRMRWGLVPTWWKKPLKELPATFNARAHSVAAKPMFRGAYKARRCIIPASGFYEWTGVPGAWQPHLFTAADGSPLLACAGLWERWQTPETGEDVLSCTMIVSGAAAWIAAYYDRMPILMQPHQFDRWLSGEMGSDELQPAAEGALREWPVTMRLNRTGYGDDDPTVIQPIPLLLRSSS